MEWMAGGRASQEGTDVEASCQATVVANSDNDFTRLKYEKEYIQNWQTGLPDTMKKEQDKETLT